MDSNGPLTLLGQSTLQLHTSQQILRTTVVYYRLWRDTLVLLYLWIYTFEKESQLNKKQSWWKIIGLFSSYNKPRICSKDYKILHPAEFCLISFDNLFAIFPPLYIQRNSFHGELSKRRYGAKHREAFRCWDQFRGGVKVTNEERQRPSDHLRNSSPMPSRCGSSREGEMGCTPSKLAAVYGEDTVCQDLDTCSTFVSSLKSSVSTPERTRQRVGAGGNPTSLSGEFNARHKIQLFDHRLLRSEIYCNIISD